MDIHIKWDNDKKSIKLPILPSEFMTSASNNNTSVTINGLGDINLKGKRGLYTLSIASFFPHQKYSFAHGKYHKPYEYYIKRLTSLFHANKTLHVLITETDINFYCTIETFEHGENERTGDVAYTLSFVEYRSSENKRIIKDAATGAYKWKKGDTWQKVVKKALGSSKTWKDVRKSNINVITKAKAKHPDLKEQSALVGYKVVIKK